MTIGHVIPEDAIHRLKRHLHGQPWFRGASLVGVGPDATIEVHSDSLRDAAMFLDGLGYRWEGYRVRIRRASS